MNTHIVLKVGHQAALAIIPMDKIIIADLSLALIGPIRRLHMMVKGGAQHFDMTLLGCKIDASKATTEDAAKVVDVFSKILAYAEFIGHDHVGVYAVDNMMGYVEAIERRLASHYNIVTNNFAQGVLSSVHDAYETEHARLQVVKSFIISGGTSPEIFW